MKADLQGTRQLRLAGQYRSDYGIQMVRESIDVELEAISGFFSFIFSKNEI